MIETNTAQMDREQVGASANNSSDFVRKLYRMLEESQYESIVRWGDDGDSFVVLENDKFTRDVLPRHFKHSNFASFVRQLNKYDFHKVRYNNEENGESAYGTGAWEFKHPEFHKDGKDSLDNIRRKAPAPRKTNPSPDDQFPAQQIDLLNGQLSATQRQVQLLQDKYVDLAQGHIVLLQQTVQVQKIVKNHDLALQKVMGVLQVLYSENQRLRRLGTFSANSTINGMGGEQISQENAYDDHTESALQEAVKALGEYNPDDLVNKDLEHITAEIALYRNNTDYSTPPNDPFSTTSMQGNLTGPNTHMSFDMHGDLDLVYPIGQTVGIDPINKEHVNNIPYSIGAQNGNGSSELPNAESSNQVGARPKTDRGQIWGFRIPRVMLVEDDKVCARIGNKFLSGFHCTCVLAKDGLEAVSKLNQAAPNEMIDLILMDIIMPNLDGVSATAVIREFNPNIPIVAMTSNIRGDDIEMYFRYGMNDILPKPFTREGMFRVLEKHLAPLKAPGMRDYSMPVPNQDTHPGYVAPSAANQAIGVNVSHISAPQSNKDDSPAARSPATSWHSPNSNSMTCPSPTSAGPPDGFNMHASRQGGNGGYHMPGSISNLRNMDSTNAQTMAAPRHRRVMSDMTNGPEEYDDRKRQRVYPPQPPPNASNNYT